MQARPHGQGLCETKQGAFTELPFLKEVVMIVVSAKDLTKEYGTDVILDKVSFHINQGDRIGIIGVNGAGKTTLLKILTGEIPCEGGAFFI